MNELSFHEWFIVDARNNIVVCTDSTKAWRFDWDNMYFYLNNSRSQKKPIRFCAEDSEIVYWSSGNWHNFSPEVNGAAVKLFMHYCDKAILECN